MPYFNQKNEISRENYLSIPAVAAILGISRIAVYKQVKKGEIKAIRVGKTYGIPKSYLQEIHGQKTSKEKKKLIAKAVEKVVKEYGQLLIRLGKE